MRTLAASPVKGTRVQRGFATSGGICVSRALPPPPTISRPPTEEGTRARSRKGTETVAPHLLRAAACKQAMEKVPSYANSLRRCIPVLSGPVCLSSLTEQNFTFSSKKKTEPLFFFVCFFVLQKAANSGLNAMFPRGPTEFLDDYRGRKQRSEKGF